MEAEIDPLDVRALRATGAVPYWFGLGFVQLKLDETRRIHFWHPTYGQVTPEEEMHDHRYDFESRIVAGEMVHEVWDYVAAPGGDHELLEVSCSPGTVAKPRALSTGWVTLAGRYTLRAGSNYFFPAGRFHRGFAKGAITFLTRGPVVTQFARLVHPLGLATVCPFSVRKTEAECWEMIEEMVREARRVG